MEYVRLGSSGLKVSRLALGMMSYGDPGWRDWVLPEEDALPLVEAASDAGVTFFDTANMYSLGISEVVTGSMLKKVFARREEYVLATKVRFPMGDGPNEQGLSRGHVMDSIDASLRRLQVDHIDLYQIHRWDSETEIDETMRALDDCVRAGKVRYLGASSMAAWQLNKAQYAADLGGWTRFITMQNHYNLLYREEEREMIPACTDMDMGLLPWSPLARGLLARPASERRATQRGQSDQLSTQWYDEEDEATLRIIGEVGAIAEERGISRAQVALAWLLSKPSVVAPIIGVTKRLHLDEAVAAIEIKLSTEELDRLESPYEARPIAGH